MVPIAGNSPPSTASQIFFGFSPVFFSLSIIRAIPFNLHRSYQSSSPAHGSTAATWRFFIVAERPRASLLVGADRSAASGPREQWFVAAPRLAVTLRRIRALHHPLSHDERHGKPTRARISRCHGRSPRQHPPRDGDPNIAAPWHSLFTLSKPTLYPTTLQELEATPRGSPRTNTCYRCGPCRAILRRIATPGPGLHDAWSLAVSRHTTPPLCSVGCQKSKAVGP
jgi:hypothetical protein